MLFFLIIYQVLLGGEIKAEYKVPKKQPKQSSFVSFFFLAMIQRNNNKERTNNNKEHKEEHQQHRYQAASNPSTPCRTGPWRVYLGMVGVCVCVHPSLCLPVSVCLSGLYLPLFLRSTEIPCVLMCWLVCPQRIKKADAAAGERDRAEADRVQQAGRIEPAQHQVSSFRGFLSLSPSLSVSLSSYP